MTLYSKDILLSAEMPLKYSEYPEAYELRVIDDDEDYYKPLYDMGPLERRDEIGEFESLAFIQNKTFKPLFMKNNDAEEEQDQDDLKKRHVSQICDNIKLIAAINQCTGQHFDAQNWPKVYDDGNRNGEGFGEQDRP